MSYTVSLWLTGSVVRLVQVVLVMIKISAGAVRRIAILNNNLLHTESVCIDNHRYGLVYVLFL